MITISTTISIQDKDLTLSADLTGLYFSERIDTIREYYDSILALSSVIREKEDQYSPTTTTGGNSNV